MSVTLLLAIILCIAVIAGIVIAVAWLGVDRFVAVWNRIPKAVRTVVNVAVGSAFAYLASYALKHVGDTNLPPEVKILLAGVFAAIFRQVNPGDANPQVLTPAGGAE